MYCIAKKTDGQRMRSHFRYSPEVLRAFSKAAERKGSQAAVPNVVLLESTIMTHGLPHPRLNFLVYFDTRINGENHISLTHFKILS